MKSRSTSVGPPQGRPQSFLARPKLALGFALAGVILALYLYAPALNGEFVLDDHTLPLKVASNQHSIWLRFSRARPVLMASYQLNFELFGDAPVSYHLVNLLIHVLNSGLVFLVLIRLLTTAGWPKARSTIAAALGALVFLIHPLQTESVSYIAGRSESLASFFLLSAYAVFLYRRRESIAWLEAIAVLFLFGLAVASKESAVSLPGILLLTDLMWPKPFSIEGPRKNWRLYALMAPGAIVAAAAIFRLLATAGTAGFSVNTFRWYEYAFTEARAIFSYIRLALIPFGQSLDHDFAASRTILEHGAIVYIALLGGLVAAAVVFRRRYPLACFGWLMFLLCLAPTSSFVPIDDALVERRMYLALIGLILIGCDLAGRLRLPVRAAGALAAATLLVFAGFCHARNELWHNPETLLVIAADQATHNPRPLLNVAELMIRHDRCDLAVPFLQRAQRIIPNNYYVEASWGRTLACLGRFEEGAQVLTAAAQQQPSAQIYEWIGLIYGKMGKLTEARAAFQKSLQLDPDRPSAHSSLALWYETVRDLSSAEYEYRKSLELDPEDRTARTNLTRVSQLKDSLRMQGQEP